MSFRLTKFWSAYTGVLRSNAGPISAMKLPVSSQVSCASPLQEPASRNTIVYTLGFVLIQTSVLLGLFVAGANKRLIGYLSQHGYGSLSVMGYGARLRHADCDLVIFGDSSALTGLDTAVLQSATGLQTCNISEGESVYTVMGSSKPLEAYLMHNVRPRILLAMFSPGLYQPYKQFMESYSVDGMAYLLVYGQPRDILHVILCKPEWVFDYINWVGRMLLNDLSERYVHGRKTTSTFDARTQRESRRGFFTLPYPAETSCLYTGSPQPIKVLPTAASVARFRKLLTARDTKVIVNIAPAAACNVNRGAYQRNTAGLHDNSFEDYPIALFNDHEVHFSASGAKLLSLTTAAQIVALENMQAGRADPRSVSSATQR